jgi:hypothetical protein
MAKYFAVYLAPVSTVERWIASTTPEQRKAVFDQRGKWMKDHAHAFSDMGASLGKTKRVTSDGISDAKNEMLGYSIVEASSHEAAAKLLKGHPNFQIPGTSIEVLEIMPMPGM